MAKPAIYDLQTLIQAGIDPKTGLPIKLGAGPGQLKEDLKKIERIKDEQMAIHRYKHYGIPFDLSSEEIERMLYYKGQLIMWWEPITKKFLLTPYALDGGIDFYGRYKTVHPVPFSNGANGSEEEKAATDRLRNYMSQVKLRVLYDVPEEILDPKEAENFDPTKCCVIIRDYTPQLSQTVIARAFMNEGLVDLKSDLFPFMKTALTNSTGIVGVRVNSQDEVGNVNAANASLRDAALNGKMYIPILGQVEMQEMTGNGSLRSQEFLLAFQGIEAYQKEMYGLGSAGVMQKASHMLESEQQMNASSGNTSLLDGLQNRNHSQLIANAVWGTEWWCEPENTMDSFMLPQMEESGENDTAKSGENVNNE